MNDDALVSVLESHPKLARECLAEYQRDPDSARPAREVIERFKTRDR